MTLERWQTLEQQLVESGQLTAGAVDPQAGLYDRFFAADRNRPIRQRSKK